jgi:hypothetical protein
MQTQPLAADHVTVVMRDPRGRGPAHSPGCHMPILDEPSRRIFGLGCTQLSFSSDPSLFWSASPRAALSNSERSNRAINSGGEEPTRLSLCRNPAAALCLRARIPLPYSRFHFGQYFCGSVYTRNAGSKCFAHVVASLAGASHRSGIYGEVVSNGASGRYSGGLGLWA